MLFVPLQRTFKQCFELMFSYLHGHKHYVNTHVYTQVYILQMIFIPSACLF